jgi:hypothetical protein
MAGATPGEALMLLSTDCMLARCLHVVAELGVADASTTPLSHCGGKRHALWRAGAPGPEQLGRGASTGPALAASSTADTSQFRRTLEAAQPLVCCRGPRDGEGLDLSRAGWPEGVWIARALDRALVVRAGAGSASGATIAAVRSTRSGHRWPGGIELAGVPEGRRGSAGMGVGVHRVGYCPGRTLLSRSYVAVQDGAAKAHQRCVNVYGQPARGG